MEVKLDEESTHHRPTKFHFAILAATVFAPVISGFASYQQSVSDIKQEFHVIRLEREREYVKKDDLRHLNDKIDLLLVDVAKIKGYLEYVDQKKGH